MIKDGFMYIAILIFIAAIMINLPKIFKGPVANKILGFAPPIVLIYFTLMLMCSCKVWDLDATSAAYSSLKSPILYAMVFTMLLRCDMKKILRLGPKMLICFFIATITIGISFILSFAIMKGFLGDGAWKSLGSLCGSWMGGTCNMLAIQAALKVDEASMVYALVMDTICYAFYVMFLLWAIGKHNIFNKWTGADTSIIDSIGAELEESAKANTDKLTWQNILILIGSSLMVSSISQQLGEMINTFWSFLDAATWTVLIITILGVIAAMTPFGKLKGTEEVSNCMLYIVIALIASRADLSTVKNAHFWLITGFLILIFHVIFMIILAKILHFDLFTCCVASLANIGGTASAPVLAGAYSSALVPVGIVMALLGYVVGTGGGLIVAHLMSFIS